MNKNTNKNCKAIRECVYPELKEIIKRENIKLKNLAESALMCLPSLSYKLRGVPEFNKYEKDTIRDLLAPDVAVEELFRRVG